MPDKTEIYFCVPGKPATAGSKRGIPFRKKDGGLGVRLLHACDRFESWRVDVRAIVSRMLPVDCDLIDGPVSLSLEHVIQRPKSHYRTGKNSHELRACAPIWPTGKPDLTKVLRALEDSLTGVLWVDDSQVVVQSCSKTYGSLERLIVRVSKL